MAMVRAMARFGTGRFGAMARVRAMAKVGTVVGLGKWPIHNW